MELSATQVYEDEDFSFTQTSRALEEEASEQVGTLSINSIDHQIKKGITKIGRLNSCDIVLDDMTVSKLHAEIEASGGQGSTWICDLKSANKTKLNNLKLQPNRSYELKDGSKLEFGKVHAIYRTCCPADNTMIPETPAPPRQKTMNTIIPNTPDSSLNNSSGVDDDGSIILGTQKDAENSVFRRPQIPQQCQSTSIDKKNTSMNKNNDSRIGIKLYTSDMINVRETRVSFYDLETQKFDEEYNTASNSIYDMETQRHLIDILEHVEANAKTSEHQSKQNICNKRASRSVTDIHDIETQNCINDINEMETQKSMVSIQNATGEKITTDIHTMETQNYADYTNSSGSNAQKSEIDKNNSKEKHLTKTGLNIHDLETQNKCIEEDTSDLETQLELGSIARCEPIRDISDMETQFEADSITNEISDRANKDKDKNDITDIEGINHENITKSPKSRSSSPRSLNLSSPGVEDYPSSPLNQSDHLLESTDLLEYFNQSIDKQEVQAFNMSTPKSLTKVSSKKNSNVENVQDMANNEENDEDIFEAPTQCSNRKFETLMSDDSVTDEEDVLAMRKVPKKTQSRKPQSEQINDNSETDAEEYIAADLTKKQCQSSKTLNKPSNEDVSNKNDPGTSVESEDMFDAQTQRLNNSTIKDTSNSSINQPQNSNEIKAAVDNTASTQIINNIEQNDQTNTPTPDINDMAPTQLILSRESSPKTAIDPIDVASRNNPNDMDDMANTYTINAKPVDCCTTENLDCENMDYELAPTQVVSETEAKEKENSTCERSSPQVNLNDTLERELTEMFDDVNNDVNNDHESPHMSTQYLENILQSSQCDDSTDKSFADKDTSSVSQKQTSKKNNAPCNQHSHNLLGTEINANVGNVNKAEIDSQNSDVYFSTVTTRRKRNILITTQEPANSVEDTTPCQDVNFSQRSKASNEKIIDDNMEYNKKRKRISKMKNESDARTETLNNENRNKTISSENNEKSLRSSKLTRQKDEAAIKMSKQVLEDDPVKFKVNDAEENTSICTSCPLENGQRAQTLDTHESDDDILTRLPAVRMSGTLSNPASPSASSTSTVLSTRSKQNTASSEKKKDISLRARPLRKRGIKNSEKNDKSSVDSHSNSVRGIITNNTMSNLTDTSDDSDCETQYQRFQQMADRVLNKKPNCLKRQDKRSREIARDESEDPKRSTDVESKNPARTSSRVTRHSSKQSDESSHNLRKKAYVKNTAYKTDESTKSETKSTVTKRKISLNLIEESVEQVTSKKSKIAHATEEYPVSRRSRTSTLKTAIDRQSPNIEYLTKRSTPPPESSSENTKFFKDNKAVFKAVLEETQEISLSTKNDGNVDSGRANVKRTRRIIYDSQVPSHINDATANEDNKKNKLAQIKETETQASQSRGKILRVLLNPIKIADDESQEVERIMARGPSNTQDKNISIRESSKAKIFQRQLRTRSRKQHNSDTETDSVLTESGSMSSEMEDSDNTQLDNSTPKAKRGRYAKISVSSLPKAQVLIKKETFKKPTRINQNSTSSIPNFSAENMASESSQDSTESDASTSSRSSRSKTANIRKKKMESNQDRSINESASRLNTSIETTSLVSTPSRTRRSTSILNNSTSSAIRHKVLFTGIMEDYNMIVKSLGGSKVEDPAKCTVLVTDKVRRTYKFLCTLAMGIPIVAIDWLRDSETTERFVDWENYILKDPAAEAKFGFRLRKSLGKAKEKKLLDGYVVVLTPNVAPPPIEEFKDIISSCGGKALLRPPAKWPERAVVLSREEDLSSAKKFIAKAPKTVTVQSTEFILTGILRQELDFVKYKLMG